MMTGDSWVTGVSRPIGKELPGWEAFFFLFHVMCALGVLNFLTALFVEAFQRMSQKDAAQEEARHQHAQDALYSVMTEVFHAADSNGTSRLNHEEMETAISILMSTELFTAFQHLEIDLTMIRTMLKHVDLDGDGVDIEEFTSRLKRMQDAPTMSDVWVSEAKIDLVESKLTERIEILKTAFTLFSDKHQRLLEAQNEQLNARLGSLELKLDRLLGGA